MTISFVFLQHLAINNLSIATLINIQIIRSLYVLKLQCLFIRVINIYIYTHNVRSDIQKSKPYMTNSDVALRNRFKSYWVSKNASSYVWFLSKV